MIRAVNEADIQDLRAIPRPTPVRAARRLLPGLALCACLLPAACGTAGDPVSAYFVAPQMTKSGPGRISLCYNRLSESDESLRRQVAEVCTDPRLLSNAVNLDICSIMSPVEARFECSHVTRSLAEERPQMRQDVIR